jgi:hypothetical protein
MASRKHHKQDSTRPTKARSRRMRAISAPNHDDDEMIRVPGTPGPRVED